LSFLPSLLQTVILNASLAFGAKTVTLPTFDPPLFLKVLKEHGVTVAHVDPPTVRFLAKHPLVDTVLPLPKVRPLNLTTLFLKTLTGTPGSTMVNSEL